MVVGCGVQGYKLNIVEVIEKGVKDIKEAKRCHEQKAMSSKLFKNLQGGSGAAPGIEASTPQSRRNQFALRSQGVCTAAAEYCGEPGRRHKKFFFILIV